MLSSVYIYLLSRDALNDLAEHFLTKMKIMVIKDIERDDIEFICKVRLLNSCCFAGEMMTKCNRTF